MDPIWIAVIAVGGLIVLVLAVFLFQFLNLYIQALFSKAKVGIFDLIGMKFRKVDPKTIVISRIRAADIAQAEQLGYVIRLIHHQQLPFQV